MDSIRKSWKWTCNIDEATNWDFKIINNWLQSEVKGESTSSPSSSINQSPSLHHFKPTIFWWRIIECSVFKALESLKMAALLSYVEIIRSLYHIDIIRQNFRSLQHTCNGSIGPCTSCEVKVRIFFKWRDALNHFEHAQRDMTLKHCCELKLNLWGTCPKWWFQWTRWHVNQSHPFFCKKTNP